MPIVGSLTFGGDYRGATFLNLLNFALKVRKGSQTLSVTCRSLACIIGHRERGTRLAKHFNAKQRRVERGKEKENREQRQNENKRWIEVKINNLLREEVLKRVGKT